MKIAIVGSGISGLTSAWLLHRHHEITLFEAQDYFGGHTDTHAIKINDVSLNVDTGFIVFNEHNYPLFTSMLKDLGVSYQDSDMSFAVENLSDKFVYNPSQGKKLFAEPVNFLKFKFYQMIFDIRRFYKENSQKNIDNVSSDISLETYLEKGNYSDAFAKHHLYPMAGALWSMSTQEVKALPLKFVLGFFSHHRMLQIKDRPLWKTVSNGSASYVTALQARMREVNFLQAAVDSVTREQSQVMVSAQGQEHYFDKVIFACHADDALSLLSDVQNHERDVLAKFEFSNNTMVLHSDASLMPKNKKLWASWTVRVSNEKQQPVYSINYWMNALQNLNTHVPVIASLNPRQSIDPEKVHAQRDYRHPKYHRKAFEAQSRWAEINGQKNTYFCGAYWGWGFHEDGVRSAHKVADLILQGPNEK